MAKASLYSGMIHCYRTEDIDLPSGTIKGHICYFTPGFLFAEDEDQALRIAQQAALIKYPLEDGFFNHITMVLEMPPETYTRLIQEYELEDGLDIWREQL
jgi:hypothetical protein